MKQYQKIASVYFIFVSLNISSSLPIVEYKDISLPTAITPTQKKTDTSKIQRIKPTVKSVDEADQDNTLQKSCNDLINKLSSHMKQRIWYEIKIILNKNTKRAKSLDQQDSEIRLLTQKNIDDIKVLAFDQILKKDDQIKLAYTILNTLNISKKAVLSQESNLYNNNNSIFRFKLNEKNPLTFEQLQALFLILNKIMDTDSITFDSEYQHITSMATTVLEFVKNTLKCYTTFRSDDDGTTWLVSFLTNTPQKRKAYPLFLLTL